MPFWDLVSLNTALAALGHLESAKQFFDSMPQRDIFSWNSIVQACVEDDIADLAALVFNRMPNRSLVSWNSLIQVRIQQTQCARALELLEEAPEFDVFTCNLAIQTYTGLGEIQFAREFFDSMDQRDIVTWATMLVAHSQHGDLPQANSVYENMPQHNAVAGTAMLVAYSNTSNLPSAIHIFKKMPELDIFAWNAMLVAYAASGNISSLEKFLNKMPMLDICSWNSTLQAYGWYGYLGKAKSVFDSMPQRDLITWNSMIAGYTQAREWNLALMLFGSMDQEGISPDTATYSSVFYACGEHGAVTQGRILHSLLEEAPDREILESLAISAALVSMYGKCGCLDEARQKLFGEYPGNRDRNWWNSMLTAYARNGHHREVVRLFRAMDLDGVPPDGVTFVTLLAACSHAGDLQRGAACFAAMAELYGVAPGAGHYACLADLLSRLGQLERAENVIHAMPYEPGPAAWTSVLGACGSHGTADRARDAARYALDAEPRGSSSYVLLSNVLGSVPG
ncbi:hypothetical protein SELMODRAFT_98704 [Selaginella moellendorffii]|uniref:Pentacotripeptide-repeat region of PRORP domain-containing protein n=1 Tax=Selaginella moellendorffii TaxID=88036 RepID=D8RPQ0_SELML|nr:hypothetical protein SELMODRAFT_98704 [Selaginella moellendorffii]